MEKRELWTILVTPCGSSHGDYHKVYATEKELEIVARALYLYWNAYKDDACACVAKRGDFVSKNDFDVLFSDCM